MKPLLLVIIIGLLAFVAHQYRAKEQAMKELAAEQQKGATDERMTDLKVEARTSENALNAAKQELATAIAERDDARRQVEAANAEIARLTATTPKPVGWFEQQLQNNSGRLNSPPRNTPPARPR